MKQTTKFKYSIKGLNEYLNKNDKQFQVEHDIQWESDFRIGYLLSEANPVVIGLLNDYGLSWDNEFVFINMEIWRPEVVTIIVNEAYEGILEDTDTWDYLGLGGDDDVDYNSSYIDCVIEAIKFARNHGYMGIEIK